MDSSGASADPARRPQTRQLSEVMGIVIACLTLTLPILLITSFSSSDAHTVDTGEIGVPTGSTVLELQQQP